jgi:hypothetical protein
MRKLSAKEGQDLVTMIQETAIRAGQAYNRQGQAFEAERQAEVALLEKAIELARPGLLSIVSAVKGAPQFMRRAELAPEIFILEDGRLAATTIKGAPNVEVIGVENVLDVVSLPELFQKQVKGREGSTLAAEKRAAKLLALVELM